MPLPKQRSIEDNHDVFRYSSVRPPSGHKNVSRNGYILENMLLTPHFANAHILNAHTQTRNNYQYIDY